MSDCCSSSSWKRANCPVCDTECRDVSPATMLQHLEAPWSLNLDKEPYFFCNNRKCNVVYFERNGGRFSIEELRRETREALADNRICFCYGIDEERAINVPEARAFVIDQTRKKACACESRNPSGRCCLKDFPDSTMQG